MWQEPNVCLCQQRAKRAKSMILHPISVSPSAVPRQFGTQIALCALKNQSVSEKRQSLQMGKIVKRAVCMEKLRIRISVLKNKIWTH